MKCPRPLGVALVGFAALWATSCHSGTGVVAGRLELVGVPYPGGPYPVTGIVLARDGSNKGRVVATTVAAGDGTFRLTLPVGKYVLTKTAPLSMGGDCHSEPVTVSPSSPASTTVICSGP